jgi:prevent-host-death family protein
VLVNVGQAKTDLSKLLARVEAGETVEIARAGVPVARLVRIEPSSSAGKRFLAARAVHLPAASRYLTTSSSLTPKLRHARRADVRLLPDMHVVLWEALSQS